jgi:hypothetical protein
MLLLLHKARPDKISLAAPPDRKAPMPAWNPPFIASVCILGPGPKTGVLLLVRHLLPFMKRLLANGQVIGVLPDSEEFLVLRAPLGEVMHTVDPSKLEVSHDPICGERILENFSSILKDLPPARRCSVPIMLSLIGARQTLVRRKSRIFCHSCREQFDSQREFPLRQRNLSC